MPAGRAGVLTTYATADGTAPGGPGLPAGMLALLSYNGPDASNHLARQLVATELNLLVGSDPSILPVVEQAHALLAAHPPGSRPAGVARDQINAVKDQLDAYNNPGCEKDPVIPPGN